ncbi:MAG: AraC family transcriptional regulator [Cytophagales bacterium]|nr:AraC family transcriptional regulator [Cytophagales bacterium]
MDSIDTTTTSDRYILDLQKLGFKNVMVLGHYNYKCAKENLETHVHPGMIEICFLEKGTQFYKVNNDEFFLKGGDLLITYPDEPHGTSGYPEEKGSLFWLLIKLPVKNESILNLSAKDSEILISRLLDFKSRHFKGVKELKHILMSIFKSYHKIGDPLKKVEINSNILVFLLRVIHCGELGSYGEISKEIHLISNYIRENIYEELDLEHLASMIHLSLSRFKHRFKEETGLPPGEYILTEKIKKAKDLIRTTSLSVTAIAYDLGFSSSSYFATVFKRFTRATPSEFRSEISGDIGPED